MSSATPETPATPAAPETPATSAPVPAPTASRGLRSLLRRRRKAPSPSRRSAPPPPPPEEPRPIPTQQDYRRRFLASCPNRTLLASSVPHVLHPIQMNGDCGFAAIARGITLAREHYRALAPGAADSNPALGASTSASTSSSSVTGNSPSTSSFARLSAALRGARSRPPAHVVLAKDVRKAMADEVRGDIAGYVDRSAGLVEADRLHALVANVSRPGLGGFWLGSEAGVLEFVMLARALDIAIALYCFDIRSQTVRRFESATAEKPSFEVRLLFTGPGASGHFDLLIPVPDVPPPPGVPPPPAQPMKEDSGDSKDNQPDSDDKAEGDGEESSPSPESPTEKENEHNSGQPENPTEKENEHNSGQGEGKASGEDVTPAPSESPQRDVEAHREGHYQTEDNHTLAKSQTQTRSQSQAEQAQSGSQLLGQIPAQGHAPPQVSTLSSGSPTKSTVDDKLPTARVATAQNGVFRPPTPVHSRARANAQAPSKISAGKSHVQVQIEQHSLVHHSVHPQTPGPLPQLCAVAAAPPSPPPGGGPCVIARAGSV